MVLSTSIGDSFLLPPTNKHDNEVGVSSNHEEKISRLALCISNFGIWSFLLFQQQFHRSFETPSCCLLQFQLPLDESSFLWPSSSRYLDLRSIEDRRFWWAYSLLHQWYRCLDSWNLVISPSRRVQYSCRSSFFPNCWSQDSPKNQLNDSRALYWEGIEKELKN